MREPAGPLEDLCVVEWTEGLSGSYAGFLLAGLGAEVMRVDPVSTGPGDRVLARGRRSVSSECWEALVAGADAVLTDESAPVVPARDGLVRCRVSAWDGRSDLPPDDALVAAATGMQAMQWSWSRRPVWLVTPLAGYMAGMLAALAVVSAVLARRRGAPGQEVSVSGLGAAMALNSGTYVTGAGTRGSLSQFGDPRGQIATYALFRTADGWLFVGALTQAFFVKLMTVLEREDLLADPLLQANPLLFGVPEVKEHIRRELDPIFARRATEEWVRLLRASDIPCGAIASREDALRDADARALGLVVPLADPLLGPTWQPGEPAAFSDTPAPRPRPAPVPGIDTSSTVSSRVPVRPAAGTSPATCLDGIRVLDLASFIAGPFCPMLLADLGADVVKVESPEGDPFRMTAFGFVGWNRGKRSLVLDLKRDEGREVFLDLARGADVVVDNFRAGVMERLGIGWDVLSAANPRLVHTSITGWGTAGPLATLPGFDPIFQARSGLMDAQGGDDDPVFHMIAYTDYMAGALGALATVAAISARERTGRGQRVDVSLFRTSYIAQAAEMIAHRGGVDRPRGGRDYLGPSACRRLYACRDGWVCVAARSDDDATRLGELAGVALRRDDGPASSAAAAIEKVLAGWARAEAVARLRKVGIPATSCLTFEELFTSPLLVGSGCILEQTHPGLGAIRMPGPFIRFEATPVVLRRSSPLLGADGAAVLAEAGYRAARIAALVSAGVVGRGY